MDVVSLISLRYSEGGGGGGRGLNDDVREISLGTVRYVLLLLLLILGFRVVITGLGQGGHESGGGVGRGQSLRGVLLRYWQTRVRANDSELEYIRSAPVANQQQQRLTSKLHKRLKVPQHKTKKPMRCQTSKPPQNWRKATLSPRRC